VLATLALVAAIAASVFAYTTLVTARHVARNSKEIQALQRQQLVEQARAERRSTDRSFRQCSRLQDQRHKQVNPLEAIVYLVLHTAAASNSSASAFYSDILPLLANGSNTDCAKAVNTPGYPDPPIYTLTLRKACQVAERRAAELHKPFRFPPCARFQ
jgi:hypothetical protein